MCSNKPQVVLVRRNKPVPEEKASTSAQKDALRSYECCLLLALNVVDKMKKVAVSLRRMLHHLQCHVCEERLEERRESTAVTAFCLFCGSTELSLCVHVDGFAESRFPKGR